MRESLHRKRGHPGGEIGIDRPTAIVASRPSQECRAAFSDDVVRMTSAGEAHCDKSGERSRFKKAAVRRLYRCQKRKRSRRTAGAQSAAASSAASADFLSIVVSLIGFFALTDVSNKVLF